MLMRSPGTTVALCLLVLAITLASSPSGGTMVVTGVTGSQASGASQSGPSGRYRSRDDETSVESAAPIIRSDGYFKFSDLGRRAPRAPVGVTLTLRYRNQDRLDAFVGAVSDPTSSEFRHYLTPGQFADRFSVSAKQEQFVVDALSQAGLKVIRRYPNRTLIDAVGASALVERFFSTEIHTVREGVYGERFANVTPARIPSSISDLVRAVILDNLVTARTFSHATSALAKLSTNLCPQSAKNSASPEACPTLSPGGKLLFCKDSAQPESGPLSNNYGTLATGVAKAFGYLVQFGCNGQGETAAIVIDDPINMANVQTYLSAAGIAETGTISNEPINGGGSGDSTETDLDVETIAGLAPGANITVYNMGGLNTAGIEDAYNQVLSDAKASVVNSSFGQCETQSPSFDSTTNSIAEQGAAEGVTFFASSGDFGAYDCNGSKGVQAPAGDPYFTSVGGINFTEDSSGDLESVTIGETYCNANNTVCNLYGGGGVSTIFPEPNFQEGIAGVITSGRNQPDISLPFDTAAGYINSGPVSFVGTSWASPALAAMVVEMNQAQGNRGWLNPVLYKYFSSSGYRGGFFPCTSGSNGVYACNASEYNQAAGIGVPSAYALVAYGKV